MRQNGWDVLIIGSTDPHQSEYPARRWCQVEFLSGFTGEAGDLVITMDHAGLWTDTRYFIQAQRQLEGSGIVLHKMRVPEQVPIPQWIASLGLESPRIAVDALCMSVAAVRELEEAVPGARIIPVADIIAPLWEDGPQVPSNPVMTIGEDICGESRESKISRLRKWLALRGDDGILISALDSIAWLLNVRGSDVEYNPVVVSYLLVTLDDVLWFVRKDGLDCTPGTETADSFAELEADGVTICDYASAPAALDGVGRLCLDPSGVGIGLYPGGDVDECPSPVNLWKAVKNTLEIDGMADAHLEDGVVMENFLYWLSQNAGMVTEGEAARYLGSLRAAVPGYKGDSFCTISAYGENAALPHYITPSEGAVIAPHGLYLVDSGGQYIFGTTDITRTVPMGPCTDLENEDYTLVLKGHIALASAIFPAGTPGCRMWRYRRNYGHGTGHGVGFYLNVHEGPQDIRQNLNAQPLLPGMITSCEPGIYREGLHGVRHENLILCRSLGEDEFGAWLGFEPLTLCHFDTTCLVPGLLSPDEIDWLNAYNRHVLEVLSPRLSPEVVSWILSRTA